MVCFSHLRYKLSALVVWSLKGSKQALRIHPKHDPCFHTIKTPASDMATDVYVNVDIYIYIYIFIYVYV